MNNQILQISGEKQSICYPVGKDFSENIPGLNPCPDYLRPNWKFKIVIIK